MKPRVNPATATRLTRRQEHVLTLIRQGYTNKELARALQISNSTAKSHVAAILSRLGATTRTQAVYLYHQQQVEAAHRRHAAQLEHGRIEEQHT